MKGRVQETIAFFMSAKSQEIVNSFWADICTQQNNNSPQISFSCFNIQVDLWVSTRLLCWNCLCFFFCFFCLFSCWFRFIIFFCFASVFLKPRVFRPNRSGIALFDFPGSCNIYCDSFAEQLRIILLSKTNSQPIKLNITIFILIPCYQLLQLHLQRARIR